MPPILQLIAITSMIAAPDESGASQHVWNQIGTVGSRVVGYPGHDATRNLIESELLRIGLGPVHKVSQRMAVPKEFDCELRIDGRWRPCHLFWPHGVGVKWPDDGFTMPFYDSGDGRLERYPAGGVFGAAVMMEFASGARWQEAGMLGAAAVLIAEPEQSTWREGWSKVADLPVKLPIIWLDRELAAQLRADRPAEVTIRADMGWTNVEATHLLVRIEGNEPALRDEPVLLSCHYDASSFVPALAPGQSQSAGFIAMLRLAEHFVADTPKRPVVLLFNGAHYPALAGMRQIAYDAALTEKEYDGAIAALDKTLAKHQEIAEALSRSGEEGVRSARNSDAAKETLRQEFTIEVDRLRERTAASDDPTERQNLATRQDDLISAIRLITRFRRLRYDDMSADRQSGITEAWEKLRTAAWDLASGIVGDLESEKSRMADNRRMIKEVFDTPFALHIALDLSPYGDQLALVHKGLLYDVKGSLHLHYRGLAKSVGRLIDELQLKGRLHEAILEKQTGTWREMLGDSLALDCEPTSNVQLPGVALVTARTSRIWEGTPHDTLDMTERHRTWKNVEAQTSLLLRFLPALVDDPILSSDFRMRENRQAVRSRLEGNVINTGRRGKIAQKRPAAGALVVCRQREKVFAGVQSTIFALTDRAGRYRIPTPVGKLAMPIAAYGLSDSSREIRLSSAAKPAPWEQKMASVAVSASPRAAHNLSLFECRQIDLYDLFDYRLLLPARTINVQDAASQSQPRDMGLATSRRSGLHVSSLFAPPGRRYTFQCNSSPLNKAFLLLNGSPDQPLGVGFAASEGVTKLTALQAAGDMGILNRYRLGELDKRGIRNKKIVDLQARSDGQLQVSRSVDVAEQVVSARNSASIAARAYPEILGTVNDTIKGVVFYLALLMPCAWCLERLTVASIRLERQVLWFFAIFVAMYFLLSMVHPAFGLTDMPIVILVAFAIVSLACLVMSILYAKFQSLVENAAAHTLLDVKEAGRAALGATSLSMGLAYMRRRRIRTAMTLITILIMTFVAMSFTGITSYLTETTVETGRPAAYEGFVVRVPGGIEIDSAVQRDLEAAMGADRVHPRRWVFPTDDRSAGGGFWLRAGQKSYPLRALIGLDSTDPMAPAGSASYAKQSDDLVCALPASAIEVLGLSELPATVNLRGIDLTVRTAFDPDRCDSAFDLDGKPITPVDFGAKIEDLSAKQRKQTTEAATLVTVAQVQQWEAQSSLSQLPARSVAFVPSRLAQSLGGGIFSLAVTDPDPAAAKEWVQRTAWPTFHGHEGQVSLIGSSSRIKITGLSDLIIPTALTVFMVLNTMLAALNERRSEIATFNSVGLAPIHTAGLFLAESLALGIIGAVGGYLLGQLVNWLLASHLTGIEMNYSSLSVVLVTSLVILTVLGASIMPARLASRLAMPGRMRQWRMPRTVGDEMRPDLPFSFSTQDTPAIMALLFDYFVSHRDNSTGGFVAEGTAVHPIEGDGLALVTRVWLAPFDLGVGQNVEIYLSRPPEGEQHELQVIFTRKTGQTTAWQRVNRPFLAELRRQLLTYRVLDAERRAELYDKGRRSFY
jgi:hypothetical protein